MLPDLKKPESVESFFRELEGYESAEIYAASKFISYKLGRTKGIG
jgi:hypothetical protein